MQALTVMIKACPTELRKKLGDAVGPYMKQAKVRRVRNSRELIAIQHPQLNDLGEEGCLILCERLGIDFQGAEWGARWA